MFQYLDLMLFVFESVFLLFHFELFIVDIIDIKYIINQ